MTAGLDRRNMDKYYSTRSLMVKAGATIGLIIGDLLFGPEEKESDEVSKDKETTSENSGSETTSRTDTEVGGLGEEYKPEHTAKSIPMDQFITTILGRDQQQSEPDTIPTDESGCEQEII